MSETHLTVGAKIRALRGLHFISQIELARAIGVHQSTFSRIENGQLPLSPEIKSEIEKYFGITLDIDDSSGFIGQLAQSNPSEKKLNLALAA